MTESSIKSAIVKVLREHGVLCWRAPAGAFGQAGLSDIIGMMPDGRFLAIEVKTPEKYRKKDYGLTGPQQRFLAAINNHGGIGIHGCSVEDVLMQLVDLRG